MTIRPVLMLLSLSLTVPMLGGEEAASPLPDPADLLVVANRDSSDITLINWRTDAVLGRYPLAATSCPHMAMMTHDGKTLVITGMNSDSVFVMDLKNPSSVREVKVGVSPEHFDISPDGRFVYVNNFKEGSLSVLDLSAGGKEIKRIPGFVEPHNVTFTRDGKKAYISNLGAHEVGVIDATQHKLLARLAIGNAGQQQRNDRDGALSSIQGIHNVTLTVDGRWGYAADGDSGQVAVIDTQKDEVVATLKVGEMPWEAYASPDGKWMLVPNNGDQTVSVIDVKERKVKATLPASGTMTGINFGPDGKKAYVVSTGETGGVLVYDLKALKQCGMIRMGTRLVMETASTTPDRSRIFLSSSTDNSVYAIDTATDSIHQIQNVGSSPWAVYVLHGENYCH